MFCLTRDNSPRNLCIMTLLILLCNEVNIISEEAFSRLLWFFWRIYLNCSLNPTMNSQFNYFVISRFFRWFYSSLVFMKHRNSLSKTISPNCVTDTKQITENVYILTAHVFCSYWMRKKKMNDLIMNKVCTIENNTYLNSFLCIIKS